ncbi:MAG: ABC transporter permease [Candidatus Viridilinea halotolerans]|uniref:ABC transporter permease n=1 Tax=Candidatus Viridilinea halotolerans TaxID=2491704 RepID=A0A426TXN3_9CHLR|nr:MAG: ABC transporter permease [Candidatus Viridilinea halotolerans]
MAANEQSWVQRTLGSTRRGLDWMAARLNLLVGGLLIATLLLTALFASLIAPADPYAIAPMERLRPPSFAHPFGTDGLGRDLFSRVVFGARTALYMALPAVLIASVSGIFLGLLAGYYGGLFDQIASRVMDAWLAFPGLLLAVVMVARMGPSLSTTIIALGIVGIPGYYRLTRNGTLSARHTPYIEAAYALGLGDLRIMLRHILPNLASPLVVLATLRLGTILLAGGALSFIGLGAQPPTAEWGTLLAAGRDNMDRAWWLALFPGLAITASVMGFNLLGDGLRDLLTPDHTVQRKSLKQ